MIDINEGKTNNYLIHGIVVIVTSFILAGLTSVTSQLLYIPAAVLFIFAILLFAATNGLQLDIANEKYRRYGKIGNQIFGQWHPITEPVSAVLMLHAENAFRGTAPMMGRVSTLDTKTLTYDIQITDGFKKKHLIYSFLEYKKATQALKEIHEALNIPVQNKVAEKLAENKRKRR
jgi:hypothetical protein